MIAFACRLDVQSAAPWSILPDTRLRRLHSYDMPRPRSVSPMCGVTDGFGHTRQGLAAQVNSIVLTRIFHVRCSPLDAVPNVSGKTVPGAFLQIEPPHALTNDNDSRLIRPKREFDLQRSRALRCMQRMYGGRLRIPSFCLSATGLQTPALPMVPNGEGVMLKLEPPKFTRLNALKASARSWSAQPS